MTQPKERPILFSAPMVRAILEGRKTVTRRVVKAWQAPSQDGSEDDPDFLWSAHAQKHPRWGFCVFGSTADECAQELAGAGVCPYGQPGDRLWVRETFSPSTNCRPAIAEPYIYGADLNQDGAQKWAATWKPSIHMPRAACRILLEISDVRVERLQAGEGETAFESRYFAEGIHRIHHGDGDYYFHPFKSEPGPGNWGDPFDAWRELWVSINGADSWNSNPWVRVVEFKLVTP